jgi:hypothetical protein
MQSFQRGESRKMKEFGEVEIAAWQLGLRATISDLHETLHEKQSGWASDSTTEPDVLDNSEVESMGSSDKNLQRGCLLGSDTRRRRGFKNMKLEANSKNKGIRNMKLESNSKNKGAVPSPDKVAYKDKHISQPSLETMPLPKWFSPCDDNPIETFRQIRPRDFSCFTETYQARRGM